MVAVDPVWRRPDPAERRPRHTRERIATTALALADSGGIEAVTMRRVAAELGAGTMTLYHYVRSKADLVALMHDALMAEQLVPADELPAEWRPALTAVARRARETFRRHPWAVSGMGSGSGAGGPHALEHFEQSLAAVAGTGLPAAEQLGIIALVDEYVAGFVLKSDLEPGIADIPEEARPAIAEYFEQQLASGRYPHVEAAAGSGPGERWTRLVELLTSSRSDERFERGLALLLDGVAVRVAR